MVCCMLLLYDIMTLLLCDIMTSWPPSSRPAPVTPSTRVPLGSRNDSCRRRGGRTLSISRVPCLLSNSLYTRCPSFQFDNIVYSVHFLIYWVAYYPGGPWYIGQKTGRERLPNIFLKTHKKKKHRWNAYHPPRFFEQTAFSIHRVDIEIQRTDEGDSDLFRAYLLWVSVILQVHARIR